MRERATSAHVPAAVGERSRLRPWNVRRSPAHAVSGDAMQKITPCLFFNGNAEDAARFYTSVFRHSRFDSEMHFGEGDPGAKRSAMAVTFVLDGQEFIALNGGQGMEFTPAISLFVKCETQEEVDEYWAKLCEGGQPVQCGWLRDKFGVSWQIVPTALGAMLQDKDAAKAKRVMNAMLKMVKLDLNVLEQAYRGEAS
jgi:predicted 3-demethylubiquinone-9 3-methyltransferase (glyoxalase superfamily)